jgi:hypothetical protein
VLYFLSASRWLLASMMFRFGFGFDQTTFTWNRNDCSFNLYVVISIGETKDEGEKAEHQRNFKATSNSSRKSILNRNGMLGS